MTVFQRLLNIAGPITAVQIACQTGLKIETVYTELVRLEALGVAHPTRLGTRFPSWTVEWA